MSLLFLKETPNLSFDLYVGSKLVWIYSDVEECVTLCRVLRFDCFLFQKEMFLLIFLDFDFFSDFHS